MEIPYNFKQSYYNKFYHMFKWYDDDPRYKYKVNDDIEAKIITFSVYPNDISGQEALKEKIKKAFERAGPIKEE